MLQARHLPFLSFFKLSHLTELIISFAKFSFESSQRHADAMWDFARIEKVVSYLTLITLNLADMASHKCLDAFLTAL